MQLGQVFPHDCQIMIDRNHSYRANKENTLIRFSAKLVQKRPIYRFQGLSMIQIDTFQQVERLWRVDGSEKRKAEKKTRKRSKKKFGTIQQKKKKLSNHFFNFSLMLPTKHGFENYQKKLGHRARKVM